MTPTAGGNVTLYRPPDYLGKAKGLRAGRLGASPAPVHAARPDDDAKARTTDAGDHVVRPTRKHVFIVTKDQVVELASLLGSATRVALDLETTGLDPRRD